MTRRKIIKNFLKRGTMVCTRSKIPVLYPTIYTEEGFKYDTSNVLHDINEIYMKYTRTNDKMATVKANEKIKTFNNQRIYKHTDPQKTYEPENPDFTYVLKVLKTDPDLEIFIQTLQSRGIDLIMLKDIQENNNVHGTDIEALVFHDTFSNEKMFFRYINYNINEECETF